MPTTLPPVVSPSELARVLRERPETRLLDVRTPGEFETELIAGAYHVRVDTLAEHVVARANVAADVSCAV